MEIQDLKDICVSIFELTNPTDKYPHSKIITDNISDDILRKEISFLDKDYKSYRFSKMKNIMPF